MVLDFIIKYKFVILFYLAVILFLYLKRKNIQRQAKVIFLYRMKLGLRWMDKYARKFREWVILFGYIGMGTGFVGLIFISYILVKNLYSLITQPAVANGVSLVLPGIAIPGFGILTFWDWIISIFVIALVHEFSHGIVARAHNIEVKNTGIVFFGPILGAFVEPNEEKLRKEKDIVQYSVLAAGSFSNIVLSVLAFLLLSFVFAPLQGMMVEPTGFTFDDYVGETKGGVYPFAEAGIQPGTIITGINDQKVRNFQEFSAELMFYRPGETITINTDNKDYSIALAENPDKPKTPFLGIQAIKNKVAVKEPFKAGIGKVIYTIFEWFNGLGGGTPGFLRWLFLLSIGIGLFNLLPLPIVDGGRMAQVFLHKLKGAEKGERRYHQISIFFLLILLLNLFYPGLTKLVSYLGTLF